MSEIHAYAALTTKGTLEPFSYDPGELGPEEVEIKVTHCGICHSDLSMLDNDWGMTTYPFVPGHEAVGTITAVGKHAKGLKVGQLVGVGWSAYSCLSCHECLSGEHNLCASNQGTIVGRHGGFADRLRVQWVWARPLPEGLDPAKAGPLLCGGVTVFNPLAMYATSPTARVGVIGIGGLGHMALQFASKWGCEVHAFTTSDSKEQEAKTLGAHFVHNTRNPDALKKLAGGLDLIISTINVPLDTPALLNTLAPHGRLHVVGAVLEPLQVPAMSVIPFIMVSQILAPDFLKSTAQINSVFFYQSSYLRAYAIDRPVITLSRLTIYWGVLFVVAFIILAACFFRPDLSLTALSNSTMQILKENFPNANIASHTLTIPQAKLLQGGLFTVIMFISAALLQAFTLASAYFNFRKWMYWTGIALLFAAPLIVVVVPIFQDSRTTLSPDILLLLTFAHHWPIILTLTAVLVIGVNLLTFKIDRELESP